MNDNDELNEVTDTGLAADFKEGRQKEIDDSHSSADLRNVSYFILFIAAVFVVDAMETGSYRTPWPVAIIVSLVAFGLYGYSFSKGKSGHLS